MEIARGYEEAFLGSLVELKETVVCFHYRRCDKAVQKKLAAECRDALAKLADCFCDAEVVEGKVAVEIKCAERSKGDVARDVCSGYDFVLCAGDDFADETMFSALKDTDHCFTVLVGSEMKETCAKFFVECPEPLIDMLKGMLVL